MTGELISQIPVHDPTPPATAKVEIENPTGPVSEWCTLAEMLIANEATIQRGKLIVITANNASFNLASQFGFTPVMLIIEGWGGGASGSAGTSGSSRGGGGGAGQYFKHIYTGTMDTTLNITIAAAEAGNASSGPAGNNGNNTTVVGTNLGTLTAHGGTAPTGGVAAGGLGGAGATGATESISGGDGGVGLSLAAGMMGYGGDAPRGGKGGRRATGSAGAAPGGGGSGGGPNTPSNGGNGAQGQVNIWAI